MWVIYTCPAINECNYPELNDCHLNATCVNTFASFFCVCDSGFSGNGTLCESMSMAFLLMVNHCS